MAGRGAKGAEILLEGVPVRLFLESQDHQHDLIRELRLIELGDRFELTSSPTPQELATMISEILVRYGEVRTVTRQQALAALDRGEVSVDLRVPIRAGMADALRRWLQLLEEADGFCRQGELLTLAARPEVRELRRWYVAQLTDKLGLVPASDS